jgi:hypothetical protein
MTNLEWLKEITKRIAAIAEKGQPTESGMLRAATILSELPTDLRPSRSM